MKALCLPMIPSRLSAKLFQSLRMIFAMLTLGLAGCGDAGPKLNTVNGSISLTNGKIVKHGFVNFHPDESKGNKSQQMAIGYIKDGTYSMKTGEKSGVAAGWYIVTVDAANEVNPDNPYVTEWFAEERYTDKTRSKLSFEVVEKAEEGRYDLKLTPHPKAK